MERREVAMKEGLYFQLRSDRQRFSVAACSECSRVSMETIVLQQSGEG